MRAERDCKKIVYGSCKGCEAHPRIISAFIEDAWRAFGKPSGINFDIFPEIYTWGSMVQRAVQGCGNTETNAVPDRPPASQENTTILKELLEEKGVTLYTIKPPKTGIKIG